MSFLIELHTSPVELNRALVRDPILCYRDFLVRCQKISHILSAAFWLRGTLSYLELVIDSQLIHNQASNE